MAIVSTDIKYRLSGGASNADPLLSLGGTKSNTDASATIFDDVSSAEATAGDTEYRCVYVHNNHGSLTWIGPKIWIQVNTPSGDTDIAIGLGSSVVNGVEPTVADEQTAPAGVVFSAPASFAGGLSLGDIPPGQHKAVWIRRTVNPAAAAYADSFTLRAQGDTNP